MCCPIRRSSSPRGWTFRRTGTFSVWTFSRRHWANSVINTVITVVISVFVSTLSAYGFACIRFPGRDKLFAVYLFTLMMPGFLNIIPQFLVLKQLTLPGLPNGLIGTRAGLILIYVATNVCGHTFFLRNFFRSLPSSLAESVLLDGGGHKDIFFRVMLPLSAPAVGTMTIFAFQGFWEEYFTAKVLVGANEKVTFPLLLQRLNRTVCDTVGAGCLLRRSWR